MKRIIALLLVLVMAFSIVACDDGGKTPSGSSSKPTGDNNELDNQEEETNIVFAENGKSKLYIVVPTEPSTGASHARTLLQSSLKERIGVTFLGGTMSNCEYELHLGNTGDEAAAIIAELEEGQFAIKTVGKKIYIVAYNDLWLYDVAEYFIETYIEDEDYAEIGEKSLALKKAINDVDMADTTTFRYMLSQGIENYDATVKKTFDVKNTEYEGVSNTVPYRRQGGCFSGTALYQSLITAAPSEKYGRIMKKDNKTGEVTYSEIRTDMGHMNAMTYNSKTNEVLVANGKKILIFDGDTLEYKKTVTASAAASNGIAYDPVNDRYILGYFNFVKTLTSSVSKSFGHDESVNLNAYNAYQGTASDGYFVVSLLANSNAPGGYSCDVAVYDMDGNYFGLIKVSGHKGDEPENISIIDGKIYVGVCTDQPVFTLYEVVFDAE